MELPPEAQQDLERLVSPLSNLGYEPTVCEVGSMHSYVAEFDGPRRLRIVCDRGQLFVDADRSELEPNGLWRAFDDREEFAELLLGFLDRR